QKIAYLFVTSSGDRKRASRPCKVRRKAMDTNTLLAILIVLVLVVLVAMVAVRSRQRKSQELQQRFGPEYQRTVDKYGDQQRAEADLAAREKRVRKLEIRPLTPDERKRFAQHWKDVQAKFVDDPSGAVTEAN